MSGWVASHGIYCINQGHHHHYHHTTTPPPSLTQLHKGATGNFPFPPPTQEGRWVKRMNAFTTLSLAQRRARAQVAHPPRGLRLTVSGPSGLEVVTMPLLRYYRRPRLPRRGLAQWPWYPWAACASIKPKPGLPQGADPVPRARARSTPASVRQSLVTLSTLPQGPHAQTPGGAETN